MVVIIISSSSIIVHSRCSFLMIVLIFVSYIIVCFSSMESNEELLKK